MTLQQAITSTVLNTTPNPLHQPPTNNPPGQRTPKQLPPPPVIPPLRPNPRPFCHSGQIPLTAQRLHCTRPARRAFRQSQQPVGTGMGAGGAEEHPCPVVRPIPPL